MDSVLQRSNTYFSDTSDIIESHEDSKKTRVLAMGDVNSIISQNLSGHNLTIVGGHWLPLDTLSSNLKR